MLTGDRWRLLTGDLPGWRLLAGLRWLSPLRVLTGVAWTPRLLLLLVRVKVRVGVRVRDRGRGRGRGRDMDRGERQRRGCSIRHFMPQR